MPCALSYRFIVIIPDWTVDSCATNARHATVGRQMSLFRPDESVLSAVAFQVLFRDVFPSLALSERVPASRHVTWDDPCVVIMCLRAERKDNLRLLGLRSLPRWLG